MAKLPIIFEPSGRHVRAEFGGEIVANSKRAMLLRYAGPDLHYLFPDADVRMEFLTPTDHVTESGYKGNRIHWTVKVGDRVVENAAWAYPDVNDGQPDRRGYIGFDWKAMDHWYEEDEEVFVHPRDPYHRVDAIPSSRHVRVVIDGVTVADTTHPYLLFETGLPTRYYIPHDDVCVDLLTPTDSHTRCPYKGVASYWSAQIGDKSHPDIVWSYLEPIPEIPRIKGLLAFYNERVDLYVDGEIQERPRTVWSR